VFFFERGKFRGIGLDLNDLNVKWLKEKPGVESPMPGFSIEKI